MFPHRYFDRALTQLHGASSMTGEPEERVAWALPLEATVALTEVAGAVQEGVVGSGQMCGWR